MAKHKWTFKSRFKSGVYSWKGTALASILPSDIKGVYVILMTEAVKSGGEQWAQAELSKRVFKELDRIKKGRKETILEILN